MDDKVENLFGIFSKWLIERWPDISGAKLAFAGKSVIFGARSKSDGFDWDFADTLCDLDAQILNDNQFDDLQVDTICLAIFDHYVSAHLEDPLVYRFDGTKWDQIKWP